MKEIMMHIADTSYPLLHLLLLAVAAVLLALFRRNAALLKAEIKNETVGKYIDMACEAVDKAVTFTAQTFVDALKAADSFTKDKQLEAFNIAKAKALNILGETAVLALTEIYGDFSEWLEAAIEAKCRELKTSAAPMPAALLIAPEVAQTVEETVEMDVYL